MKAKAMKRWRVLRERGRARFVLFNGVLGWGASVFVLVTFVVPTLLGEPRPSPAEAGISAVAFILVGGPIFGFLVWSLNERAYRRARSAADASRDEEPDDAVSDRHRRAHRR